MDFDNVKQQNTVLFVGGSDITWMTFLLTRKPQPVGLPLIWWNLAKVLIITTASLHPFNLFDFITHYDTQYFLSKNIWQPSGANSLELLLLLLLLLLALILLLLSLKGLRIVMECDNWFRLHPLTVINHSTDNRQTWVPLICVALNEKLGWNTFWCLCVL